MGTFQNLGASENPLSPDLRVESDRTPINPEPERRTRILKLKLSTQIFLGILLGLLAGVLLGEHTSYVRPVGTIFLRLLKMIIVPLILASVVTGVAGIGDVRNLGRIGGKTILYYLTTTGISVIIGLILVNLVRPGVGADIGLSAIPERLKEGGPSLLDTMLRIVPTNPFQALAEADVLPLIAFALIFGAVLTTLGEKGRTLIGFFDGLNEAMLKITDLVMRLAPLGVFALMADIVGHTGIGVLKPLIKYMAVVLIGLLIHGAGVLPLLLHGLGKTSAFAFAKQMSSALATAFTTSSSSASLPVSMECAEENAGLPNRIVSFVLPLGATINMDGTALYESVAAIFIAQAYGIELTLGSQIVIFLTATLAAIGAAGIPGAGLVTMAVVLKAVGLPLEGIGLVLAVDRILDMCRTTVNVWGDCVGAAVIARSEERRVT
ncbi:MAG: dicarboxylate/amino acid:cation symporter [Candidatus Latescibacteria bacterium]|nr:dicarboxylate/amino acid:cation symporter [Candidatus Latescibacterota bacterium]MCK5327438.1 dicarboxylate/amino acid:cation symporter [Candidatus Latescibacterota bacterium]MCK5733493.1 dicarboxylate/amino acid:cation symporter [Candidatus Latescibacterota bacterium]